MSGSSTTFYLNVNTDEMVSRDYSAEIIFYSNDPTNLEDVFPVDLSVTGAPAGQLAILKKIASPGPSGQDIEMRTEGGTIILYDTKTDNFNTNTFSQHNWLQIKGLS